MNGLLAEIILAVVMGALFGLVAGILANRMLAKKKVESAEDMATKILEEAHRAADAIKKETALTAKDTLYQLKVEFEKETKERRNSLSNLEKRLLSKEEHLDKKQEQIDQRDMNLSKQEKGLNAKIKTMEEREVKYNELVEEQMRTLERISGITGEQAKSELISMIEDDAKHEAAKSLRKIEEELKENSDKKAKEIISTAIQRYAGDYVMERTVSIVNLPSDEMKGRIIGREGRNIRAIEAATGVDLVIDDTP